MILKFIKYGNFASKYAIAEGANGIEYYQVSQSVMDENTLARELAPLEAIKDNYPKFILTRDYDNNNYAGIQHINVLQWLLGK